MVAWIAEITKIPEPTVRSRLLEESKEPGRTVRTALEEAGIPFYTWTEGLARFYEHSDAFLYELVVWNLNPFKSALRRDVTGHLQESCSGPLDVLSIGDGLGVDSVHFARLGHRLTYYEVPGFSEAFARRVFRAYEVDITVVTAQEEIPQTAYDAIVCLDVLEHVPDPPAMVKTIASYLRPGGRLIVNAPFWAVHPRYPTHLESNRRFTGRLDLYEQAGLRLLDGNLRWSPIVLTRVTQETQSPNPRTAKRLALRLSGMLPPVPFWLGIPVLRYAGRWFGVPPVLVQDNSPD